MTTYVICAYNGLLDQAAKEAAKDRPVLKDPYLFSLAELIPQCEKMKDDEIVHMANPNICTPVILKPEDLTYKTTLEDGRMVTNGVFRLNGFDRPVYTEDGNKIESILLWIDVNVGQICNLKTEAGMDRHVSLPLAIDDEDIWDDLRPMIKQFVEVNSDVPRKSSGKFESFTKVSLGEGTQVDLMRVTLADDLVSAFVLMFEDTIEESTGEGVGYIPVKAENFTPLNLKLESSRGNLGKIHATGLAAARKYSRKPAAAGVSGVAPNTPAPTQTPALTLST